MKTQYRYIIFQEAVAGVWECRNKKRGDKLCNIVSYKTWNQWVMADVNTDAIFNNACLRDIADFLDQLNENGGK